MDTTGIKFIDELDLSEKTVFIRVDFNVPLDEDGNVTDDTRIRAALPTIDHAMKAGAKVILASHLGRPKGEPDPKLSLEPVGDELAGWLDCEVLFPEETTGDFVKKLITDMRAKDQVMLLENLRFNLGEKGGDEAFAAELAELADVYVNDAFGTSHRKHASMYHIAKHFDRNSKAAGFLIKNEIKKLGGLVERKTKNFTAIMGGAKVSDKLGVLDTLIERVSNVLIGGAMAYTFLEAMGIEVGSSRVEKKFVKEADAIMKKAERRGVGFSLPVDHVVASDIDAPDDQVETTQRREIPAGKAGFDIGPKTIDNYETIIDNSATIFWNGPMGVFERDVFAKGTMAVAHAIAESGAFSVIGGGDSASAVNKAGVTDKITHVSTGGGASLQMVEGKPLPGIEALRANYPFE